MKREDIEKAASKHSASLWDKNIIDCSRDFDFVYDSFVAGAEWRINSVWHDMSKEIPKEGKRCLIETTYKNGYIPHYRLTQWYEVNEFVNQDDAKVRWAYIEDLIPNTEE